MIKKGSLTVTAIIVSIVLVIGVGFYSAVSMVAGAAVGVGEAFREAPANCNPPKNLFDSWNVFDKFFTEDGKCECESGAGEAGTLVLVGKTAEDAKSVMNWLMGYKFKSLGGKGMTKEQAAGVAGNIMSESSFNPKAKHSGSGATGLFQWMPGGRLDGLQKMADKQGTDIYNANTQMLFMVEELEGSGQIYQGKRAADSFGGKATNPSGINKETKDSARFWAKEWFDLYEGMEFNQDQFHGRAEYADQFMNLSGGGASGAEGSECDEGGGGVLGADCTPIPGKGLCYPLKPTGKYQVNTYDGHPAEAKDIPAPEGTPVYAMSSGTIQQAVAPVGLWCPFPGYFGRIQYGVVLKLDKPIQGANTIMYTHFVEKSPLKTGTKVKGGDFIGKVGNTGCSTGDHLHIEFTRGTGVNLAGIIGRYSF